MSQNIQTLNYVVGIDLNDFNRKTKQVQDSFGQLTRSAVSLGAKMSLAFMFEQALEEMLNFTSQFDQRMREIWTLTEYTREEFQGLNNDLLELSKSAPFALNDLASSMYWTISSGIDAGEAIEFMSGAVKAAVAGVSDLYIAVDGLTTVMNAWNKSVEEINSVNDTFFIATKYGKTTFEQLTKSIGRVAPFASQAGLTFEEIASALAALTRQGLSTNMAMTSLARLIGDVITPSRQAAEFADFLGVEFSVTAMKAKGLSAFLQDLKSAIEVNADRLQDFDSRLVDSNQALNIFFDRIQSTRAVFALTGNAADDFSMILGEMDNKTGVTDIAFQKMIDSLENLKMLFENAKNTTFVQFGEGLEDLRKELLTAGIAFFQSLQNLSSFDKAVLGISTSIIVLVPLVKRLIIAFQSMNTVMNANPWTLVAKGISLLATAFLSSRLAAMAFGDQQEKVQEQITALANSSRELEESLYEASQADFARITQQLKEANKQLKLSVDNTNNLIDDTFELKQLVEDYNYAQETGIGNVQDIKGKIEDILEGQKSLKEAVTETNGQYNISNTYLEEQFQQQIKLLELQQEKLKIERDQMELQLERLNNEKEYRMEAKQEAEENLGNLKSQKQIIQDFTGNFNENLSVVSELAQEYENMYKMLYDGNFQRGMFTIDDLERIQNYINRLNTIQSQFNKLEGVKPLDFVFNLKTSDGKDLNLEDWIDRGLVPDSLRMNYLELALKDVANQAQLMEQSMSTALEVGTKKTEDMIFETKKQISGFEELELQIQSTSSEINILSEGITQIDTSIESLQENSKNLFQELMSNQEKQMQILKKRMDELRDVVLTDDMELITDSDLNKQEELADLIQLNISKLKEYGNTVQQTYLQGLMSAEEYMNIYPEIQEKVRSLENELKILNQTTAATTETGFDNQIKNSTNNIEELQNSIDMLIDDYYARLALGFPSDSLEKQINSISKAYRELAVSFQTGTQEFSQAAQEALIASEKWNSKIQEIAETGGSRLFTLKEALNFYEENATIEERRNLLQEILGEYQNLKREAVNNQKEFNRLSEEQKQYTEQLRALNEQISSEERKQQFNENLNLLNEELKLMIKEGATQEEIIEKLREKSQLIKDESWSRYLEDDIQGHEDLLSLYQQINIQINQMTLSEFEKLGNLKEQVDTAEEYYDIVDRQINLLKQQRETLLSQGELTKQQSLELKILEERLGNLQKEADKYTNELERANELLGFAKTLLSPILSEFGVLGNVVNDFVNEIKFAYDDLGNIKLQLPSIESFIVNIGAALAEWGISKLKEQFAEVDEQMQKVAETAEVIKEAIDSMNTSDSLTNAGELAQIWREREQIVEELRKNQEEMAELARKKQSSETGSAVGGGIAGAAAGAAIGSMFGPVGTLLGGLIGGIAGGAAGTAINNTEDFDKAIEKLSEKNKELADKIKDLKKNLQEALGIDIDAVASEVKSAFSAETFEDFTNQFYDNLYNQTRNALVDAFMSSEVFQAAMGGLTDSLTDLMFKVLGGGEITDEDISAILDQAGEVSELAQIFYDTILPILEDAFGDLLDFGQKQGELVNTAVNKVSAGLSESTANNLASIFMSILETNKSIYRTLSAGSDVSSMMNFYAQQNNMLNVVKNGVLDIKNILLNRAIKVQVISKSVTPYDRHKFSGDEL